MTPERHIARRKTLIERMNALGGGVAIIPTSPERLRNRDSHHPYRADSYFLYLSGFGEPESVLVIIAGDAPQSILFCREKHAEREVWDGFRHGPEAARDTFGFDEAHSIHELDARLPDLIADQPVLWHALGSDAAFDARIIAAMETVRGQARTGKRPPPVIRDPRSPLDEMRLIKDDAEIATMRRAAAIAAQAHRRAMRACKPGLGEWEIEAEIAHEFRRAGCQSPAYTSIVAGGAGACTLHYVTNDETLKDGELLLIDAGCELDGYASDITRTFPVNGRFSGPQRDIYQLVLAAQAAAVAQISPGRPWNAPHDAAVAVLTQGLLDLKLICGDLESAIANETYKRFYMHRTGHWLGMDVHDCGDYKIAGEWRPLQAGMMLTVEPGCYIRPADDIPEAFWNIGIRIEDDVLVTATGCDILTTDAPKSISDIEHWMRSA